MTSWIAGLTLLLCLASPGLAVAENLRETLGLRGALRHEFAVRSSVPQEITKAKTIGFLTGNYAFNPHLRLRLAARAFYDAVYDLTDTFPPQVARDQDTEVALRQALLDVSWGAFDAHLGLQQIVWGEAVGTFIADVVNPKDFREFVLPEFRDIRRPIWALDMTYYLARGLLIEGVWTPHLLFHRLPLPGAEFAFRGPSTLPGVQVVTEPTHTPAMTLAHSQGGIRLSWLTGGWDLSLLYFDAFDYFPTRFTRQTVQPGTRQAVVTMSPRHTRLHMLGATVGKTFEPVVLRSEIVATFNKFLQTADPRDSDGVVRAHVLNYMLGLDYTLLSTVTLGVQFLQQLVPGATAGVHDEQQRHGSVSTALAVRLEAAVFDNAVVPQVLFVMNLDRGDYRLSPRLVYQATGAVSLAFGADIFAGPDETLYGQFDSKDRVYTEVGYQF